MEFKRIPKDEAHYEDKFILEMDFYECNEFLCLVLPHAIEGNKESFRWDVKNASMYTQGDKRRTRALKRLQDEIQTTFNKMWEEN